MRTSFRWVVFYWEHHKTYHCTGYSLLNGRLTTMQRQIHTILQIQRPQKMICPKSKLPVSCLWMMELKDLSLTATHPQHWRSCCSLFKDIKMLKTPCSIKMVTQLTAVAEYVKVCHKYVIYKRSCLNASLVVARHMGKGPYFAHQVHWNEAYLI